MSSQPVLLILTMAQQSMARLMAKARSHACPTNPQSPSMQSHILDHSSQSKHAVIHTQPFFTVKARSHTYPTIPHDQSMQSCMPYHSSWSRTHSHACPTTPHGQKHTVMHTQPFFMVKTRSHTYPTIPHGQSSQSCTPDHSSWSKCTVTHT